MRRSWSLGFASSLVAAALYAAEPGGARAPVTPPPAPPVDQPGAMGGPALSLGGHVVPEWALRTALGTCANLGLGREACLKERFIPAFRWAVSGYELKLDVGPAFQRVRAGLLLERLVSSLRDEPPRVAGSELEKYYEVNRHEFVKPERVRVFRILFSSEHAAKKVIAELPTTVALEQFRALARTHSIDHATHLRGGDLGFVGPDGVTDVPEVRADPVIYARASALKDGELLREVVGEGQNFAVIWRRGSAQAVEKTLGEVSDMIEQRLRFSRGEERLKSLIEMLRSKDLHSYAPAKLEIYEQARKPSL